MRLILLSSLLLSTFATGAKSPDKRVLPGSLMRKIDATNSAKLWRLVLTSMQQQQSAGERREEEVEKLVKELTSERFKGVPTATRMVDDLLR